MYSKLPVLAAVLAACAAAATPTSQVAESARQIPVAGEVDVVVIGGTTGAVAAATAAAGKGARVMLVAPKTYLGEDMCATMRLWLEAGEQPGAELARQLFADSEGTAAGREPVRPLHVKKTLDDALLGAKVPFLFSSYATDVLRDAKGQPAGVVINNRAGRQAIVAKVIIDATSRAWVARLAGAKFQPYPAGKQTFLRYVVGGAVREGGRALPLAYRGDGTATERGKAGLPVPLVEYRLEIPMADGSFPSFARAEQIARDMTYDDGQKAAAEELFQVPPDPMRAVRNLRGEWTGMAALNLEAFRPAGVPFVFVLSGCAGVSRPQAARLLRPPALVEAGLRVGAAAAELASSRPDVRDPRLAARPGRSSGGDTGEELAGLRPAEKPRAVVRHSGGAVPVLGEYDVVVVGGGTAGAPAAIAAARSQARTLLVEALHGLGGVGTLGMISTYWWGFRGGFTKEVPGTGNIGLTDAEARRQPGVLDNPRYTWDPLQKAEWFRRTLRKEGVEVWFGVQGAGAWKEGKRVRGIVVATPQGRGVVLAKAVVDATGNADVAAAAGARTVTTGASELAVQGTGLPSINLGSGYVNTDFTIVDETDMLDVWHVLVYAKSKYFSQFDMGQLIDSRERRRVVGDFEMTILDQMTARTYPDTVAFIYSNFDTHGYTVDPYFLVDHPERHGFAVNFPYRCLLPKELDGLLVAGLGVSVQRDALPLIRTQPDIQNQGFAAGMAAAMAAKAGTGVRDVDVQGLQRRLVQAGALPESVLRERDSHPIPEDRVAKAASDFPHDRRAAAVLLSAPETASVLLRKTYLAAPDAKEKFECALMLAVLGDASGMDLLVAALDSKRWDKGWQYTGMGQFGQALSEVDRLLVAMARTRDKRALAPILRKAAELGTTSEFSHYRAVALALEAIGDPAGAEALARLLSLEGMRGNAITSVEQAARRTGLNVNETHTRAFSLRELDLARALYRCGDKNGIGRTVLTEYTKDLRGHLARHARAVLEEVR